MAKKLDRKGMFKALKAALPAPKVPPFAGLVLGLTSAGAKIVPQDLWDEIGEAFKESDRFCDVENEEVVGAFRLHHNHARSEAHEVWQPGFVDELLEKAGKKTVWLIPVDELLCMAYDDEFACDFVDLRRWSFIGTEKQLRKAVKELIVFLKTESVQDA